MPWIDVTTPFDWKPRPNVMQAIGGGHQKVTTPCAAYAVEKGFAKRVRAPRAGQVTRELFGGADPDKFDHDGKDGPGGSALPAAEEPAG